MSDSTTMIAHGRAAIYKNTKANKLDETEQGNQYSREHTDMLTLQLVQSSVDPDIRAAVGPSYAINVSVRPEWNSGMR